MYFTFEGPEGGGKNTQSEILVESLEATGFDVLVIEEPGGTPTGLAIRDVLLDQKELKILPIAELFLFSASRAQAVKETIRQALKEGKIVISIRSHFSTIVYQGIAGRVDLEDIKTITDIAIGDIRPDYAILLDLPVKIGITRKHGQDELNRIDLKTVEYHELVREGYLQLAKENPEVWNVFDATESVEDIQEKILEFVLSIIVQSG